MRYQIILSNPISSFTTEQMVNLKGFLVSELKLDIPTAQKIVAENLPIYESDVLNDVKKITTKLLIVKIESEIVEIPEEVEANFSSFLEDPAKEAAEELAELETKIPSQVKVPSSTLLMDLSRVPKEEHAPREPLPEGQEEPEKPVVQKPKKIRFKKLQKIREQIKASPRLQNLCVLLIVCVGLHLINSAVLPILYPTPEAPDVKIITNEIDPNLYVAVGNDTSENPFSVEVKTINYFLKAFSMTFSTKQPPSLTPEEIILGKTSVPWVKSGSVNPTSITGGPGKEYSFLATSPMIIGYGNGEQKLTANSKVRITLKDLKSGTGNVKICYRCSEITGSEELKVLPDGEVAVSIYKEFSFSA